MANGVALYLHPQQRSLQRSQQWGFAVKFCSEWTEDVLRPLLRMLIQCNPVIHSLYSSSCSLVVAFLLILAQKLPYLMGQSSTTCILVVYFIVYLELHYYVHWQACTMKWAPSSKGHKNGVRRTSEARRGKVLYNSEFALEWQSPCSSQNHRESTVGVGFWRVN
jgi:hypothetical protein